ncbi:MAG: GAF domain-containing sensor histidine kinase [Chloroflexi bacterium]|nr:GAF domain-containing sensor histidine kinase [Chloroflexota bacterium]
MKPDVVQETLARVANSAAILLAADASLLVILGRGTISSNLPSTTPLQRQLLQVSSPLEAPFLWEIPQGTRLTDGREADSGAGVRLRSGTELFGAIGLLRARGAAPFGPPDLGRLGALATMIGPSLEAHLGMESTLGLLVALGEACRAGETQELLDKAVEGVARALGASGASLMLLDESGDLVIRAARGLPDEVVRGARRRLGEGISGYVATSGEPLLLKGAVQDPRFQGVDPGIDGAITVPLRGSKGVLGVLNLRRKAVNASFSLGELRLALGLAKGLAGALERVLESTRADEDRRQALTMYELGRLARAVGEEGEALRVALAMAGDRLGATVGIILEQVAESRWKVLASRGFDDRGEYESRLLEDVLRKGHALNVRSAELVAEKVPWGKEGLLHVAVPLHTQDAKGALVLAREDGRFFDKSDLALAEAIGIEIGGLWEELRRRNGEDARLVAEERQRIAQELHDGLAQELSGVLLAIEGSQLALARDSGVARRQLGKAVKSARECLRDVRRYLTALRWEEGQAEDAVTPLETIVEEARRHGLAIELRVEGHGPQFKGDAQRTVLRIAQEALANVNNHAHAHKARVVLTRDAESVWLSVEDDGIGFAVADVMERSPDEGHYGLLGMRERAESVGGRLDISSEPGQGTKIELLVPLTRGKERPVVLALPAAVQSPETVAALDDSSEGHENGEGPNRSKSLFHRLPTLLKR